MPDEVGVDPRVHEVAELFVESDINERVEAHGGQIDTEFLKHIKKEHTDRLARELQQAIESFLEFDLQYDRDRQKLLG